MRELSIYTYTIVYSATAEFAGRVPYCAAILEQKDGVQFPALVEGYEEGKEVFIGQPVYEITGEDDAVDCYSF